MPTIGQLGMQAASAATGGILGMVLQGENDARQYQQQQQLQALQIAGNKEMSDYNYKKQMEMWNATNYEAQRKHLEAAGLNPGLLYGMSGGGGTTTGSGGGAGVSGAEAPKGGGEIMMGIQMGMQQAQLDLIRAQTEKTKAETVKTAGVDTKLGETQIGSLTQGIQNAKAQQALTEIQTQLGQIEEEIKGSTQNAAKALIMQELRSSYEKLDILKNEGAISDATIQEKIQIIQREALAAGLKNILTRAQTTNTQSATMLNKQEWDQKIGTLMMAWNRDRRDEARLILQQLAGQVDDGEKVWKMAEELIEGILKGPRKAPINLNIK